jgi:hypothetical protein
MIITRTPLRVSFFGGGTDFPEFFQEEGGAVVSAVSGDGVWTSLILAAVAVVWLGLMLGVRELVRRRETAPDSAQRPQAEP